MAKSSINKVKNLKQVKEVWEVAIQPANTWIESTHGGSPYRPWYVLVMSQDDKVVRHDLLPKKPSPHEAAETIFKGMRRPLFGAGRKRRPSKILVDNNALYRDLTPLLETIEIACEKANSLPYSASALKEINIHLNIEEDEAYERTYSLSSLPGVTVPLLGKLFEAMASFYHLAPWEMLPEEESAIEIRYPVEAEPRYAIVIGRAGESFGLSINDSLAELKDFIEEARGVDLSSGNYSVLSCTYEEAHYLTFKDLDLDFGSKKNRVKKGVKERKEGLFFMVRHTLTKPRPKGDGESLFS